MYNSLYLVMFEVSSIGLLYGLSSVCLGQFILLAYLWLWNRICRRKISYSFSQSVWHHVSQIEGLFLLGSYLCVSWYGQWLPSSYYQLHSHIQWDIVFLQLIVQDASQYIMHRVEHSIKPLYSLGHVFHHKHIHPRWFEAFDGSILDTTCMVLLPLVITSRVVYFANTWSYIAFGTIYSMSLVLIHSEYDHPWEGIFRFCLIGTSADHHIHHRFFVCNYGHVFMWWDVLFGTYRNPSIL